MTWESGNNFLNLLNTAVYHYITIGKPGQTLLEERNFCVGKPLRNGVEFRKFFQAEECHELTMSRVFRPCHSGRVDPFILSGGQSGKQLKSSIVSQ